MNEDESEKQNPQERRNVSTVVVDGVKMVPKEWVEKWKKLSSEWCGNIVRLTEQIEREARVLRATEQELVAVQQRIKELESERDRETLDCGHPASLAVITIEGEKTWCGYCDCQKQRNYALKRERELREELTQLRQSLANYGDLAAMAARSQAWFDVCEVLDKHCKGWGLAYAPATITECAVKAIADMARRIKELEEGPSQRSDKPLSFTDELTSCLNRHSQENASSTPDYMLAQFLESCLAAWNTGVQQRETWYGRDARPASFGAPVVAQQTPKPPML